MARPVQFTDDQIRSKIEELAASGASLTAFGVRRALGGGNIDRISALLTEWLASKSEAATETIDLPADLKAEVDHRLTEIVTCLSGAIAAIHRRATELAESRVTEAVKSARMSAMAAEAQLSDASAVLTDTDAQLSELRLELQRLRAVNEEKSAIIAALNTKMEYADRCSNDQAQQISALAVAVDMAKERAFTAEAKAKEGDAERQRALLREQQLSEQIAEFRTLFEAKFEQLKR